MARLVRSRRPGQCRARSSELRCISDNPSRRIRSLRRRHACRSGCIEGRINPKSQTPDTLGWCWVRSSRIQGPRYWGCSSPVHGGSCSSPWLSTCLLRHQYGRVSASKVWLVSHRGYSTCRQASHGVPQCCLTPRSSGAPTACRTGHQALGLRPILRLLSSAPRRRCPLSSNVRPHSQPPVAHHPPEQPCPQSHDSQGPRSFPYGAPRAHTPD